MKSDPQESELSPKRVAELEAHTEAVLGRLPQDIRVFLELRFGMRGKAVHSHRTLSKILGVSTKRLREAEMHALRSMMYGGDESAELGLRALQVNRHPPIAIADAIQRIEKLTPDLITHLRQQHDDLHKLPWNVFEHLVAEFLAAQGFQDVRLVGRDPRTSADLYAAVTVDAAGVTFRFFIEVKRWREKVGVTVINEVLGAMLTERDRYGWHAGMIVAIGGFAGMRNYSRTQLELRGVHLKDKSDLLRWLSDYRPNENGLWLPDPDRRMP